MDVLRQAGHGAGMLERAQAPDERSGQGIGRSDVMRRLADLVTTQNGLGDRSVAESA